MADSFIKTTSSLFTISVNGCYCLVDTYHDDEGKEIYTFKLTYPCDSVNHLYAYEPAEGLVEINQKNGAVISGANITEAFLSLDLENVDAIKDFINRYGFFLPVPDDTKYHSIGYVELYIILRRFQMVVELMTELNQKEHNYNYLTNTVLRLNFGRHNTLSFQGESDFIQSGCHPLTAYWYDKDADKYIRYIDPEYANLPSYVLDEVDDQYEKDDVFLGKRITYWQSEDFRYEFENYMSNNDIAKDPWAKGMLKLRSFYSCYYPFEENAKLLIHFLCSLIKKEENILDWNGAFSINPKWDLNTDELFTDHHKEVIIKLARQTIKEEFDTALMQVHPQFNAETMTPSWSVSNLYTALFFSIFYTDPKYEMFRHCANPGCTCMFKVRTSNSRKRYCSLSCQNAAAQARHRTKLKTQ